MAAKLLRAILKGEIDLLKFMRLILFCMFFCLVTTQCWSESTPINSAGLLLGLRSDPDTEDSNKSTSYRTLWITSVSGKVKILTGAGITVPYGSGFWQINNDYFIKEGSNELWDFAVWIEYLRANPLGKPVNLTPDIQIYALEMVGEWRSLVEEAKLLFVGNRYVGIERSRYYDSGGTYRPDFGTLEVREIKNINRLFQKEEPGWILEPEKCVSVKRVFGAAVDPYLKLYLSQQAEEPSGDLEFKIENVSDEHGWGLIRRNARWIPQFALKWYCNYGWSAGARYDLEELPLPIPPQLMVYNNAACDFNQIKKAIPNAKDAFVAPDGTLSVVFTPGKLLIYLGKNYQNPAAIVKLGSAETSIMGEWALGSYVTKWTSTLKNYLKKEVKI